MITIHIVKYATQEGNQWEYRTATITDTEQNTAEIRATADRYAVETDPALAFVTHDINSAGTVTLEDMIQPEPQEPTA